MRRFSLTALLAATLLTACGPAPVEMTAPLASSRVAAQSRSAGEFQPVKLDEVDAGMPYNVPAVPVSNPQSLVGKRIAIVAAHGFEEVEVTYPLQYLRARGATVDVISPDWIKDRVMAIRFLKPSVWVPVTKNISQANLSEYQGIIVPGGAWNPVIMRTDSAILNFVKGAYAKGLMVASICHGPQVLLSAGIVKGLDITGVNDIRGDLANAGAHVINDQPVVLSKNVLTSRDPNDLAEFSKAIERFLTAGGTSLRSRR